MRPQAVVLLLPCLPALMAHAQSREPPTRQVRDAEGRVIVTVPETWNEKPLAGNQVLRVRAPGPYGGHDLIVVRESGQGDRAANRERYLSYDSSQHPGSTTAKCDEPYFGYRLNDPARNRVLLRAFLTDGMDGLVVSVNSRYQHYDRLYAEQIEKIVASVRIGKGSGTTRPELEGEPRRVHDPEGRVSLVAPASWHSLETSAADELLLLALEGARKGPRMLLKDWGGPTGAGLLLLRISAQWKRAYGQIAVTRMPGEPPRMMVKNRIPGSLDYLTAFEAGGRGYTLMLTVRQDAFERYRTLADEVASTLAFSGGPYVPPTTLPGDLEVPYKRVATVHARSEDEKAAKAAVRALSGFERSWRRVGIDADKDAGPIHIVVVPAESFAEVSHRFGSAPATYDPVSCAVVAVLPPMVKGDERATWNGKVFAAMAEASLHRDLECEAPPWLRSGLASCMDASGRSGERTDAAHPVLLKRLQRKVSADNLKSLAEIEKSTRADFEMAETLDATTLAWGYAHLLLHGRSALSSHFKKWVRAMEKAPAGEAPPFDRKGYDKAREDLAKHVERTWGL